MISTAIGKLYPCSQKKKTKTKTKSGIKGWELSSPLEDKGYNSILTFQRQC